jgi:hypothetical protein
MKRWAALCLCASASLSPRAASAQKPPTQPLFYVKQGALWERDAAGTDVKIVPLPAELGTPRAIEVTPRGRLIVLDFGPKQAWVVPSENGPVVRTGACTGRARPSPTEEIVLCPSDDKVVMQATTADVTIPLPVPIRDAAFLGPSGLMLVGTRDAQVVGIDRRRPRVVNVLAGEATRSHLVVSPDGKTGVAVFGEGDASRFRVFQLDGQGVSRQLGGPGVPVVFSPDSQWVLVQEGILDGEDEGDDDDDGGGEGSLSPAESGFVIGFPGELLAARPKRGRKPPRKKSREPKVILAAAARTRACVARAAGGEVKCWPDFEGLAVSADSLSVLLKKGDTLYVGEIPGVRPTPPKKLLEGVDGPATWQGQALP